MKRLICLFLFCSLSISSTAHAAEIRTVALTGQQVPGMPDGEIFNSFDMPVLNDAGQTAFFAFHPFPNNMGLWSEGSGSLALVARSGQQAPGMPDGVSFAFYTGFDKLVLNDAGQTAFRTFIYEPDIGTNDEGIWSEGSGVLALVARTGEQAAGTPSGVLYTRGLGDFVLNNAGQTAFYAPLTGSGVVGTNNSGLWSEGPGSLTLLARSGDHAPGTPSGVNFIFIARPALNDAGHTAFFADLIGTGVISTNNRGIWSDSSGTLALVAREGSQAPGTASGVNFNFLGGVYPALNNVGQTAFASRLTGSGVDATNDRGIWSDSSGSLELVARAGDQAPGMPTGVNYGPFFTDPLLNDAGQIAFIANLVGTGVDSTNNGSIWSEGSGNLSLVAREGDHAPGTPDGVVFDLITSTGTSLVLNAAGQTAFYTHLTGPGVDFTNDIGFWATDRSGDLQLIARMGDLLEVAPGDFRTISSTSRPYFPTGNSDGRGSFFNNRGQLAFWASFTDGTSGIFVSNRVAVPEPSTILLAAAAFAGLLLPSRAVGRNRTLTTQRVPAG